MLAGTSGPEETDAFGEIDEQIINLLDTLCIEEAVSSWMLEQLANWYDAMTTESSTNAARIQSRMRSSRLTKSVI